MKRVKRVRVKFTLVKDFDRRKRLSESELDELKSEVYQKTGWTPVKLTQRIVHAFVTPERTEDSEVGITGKIKQERK